MNSRTCSLAFNNLNFTFTLIFKDTTLLAFIRLSTTLRIVRRAALDITNVFSFVFIHLSNSVCFKFVFRFYSFRKFINSILNLFGWFKVFYFCSRLSSFLDSLFFFHDQFPRDIVNFFQQAKRITWRWLASGVWKFIFFYIPININSVRIWVTHISGSLWLSFTFLSKFSPGSSS